VQELQCPSVLGRTPRSPPAVGTTDPNIIPLAEYYLFPKATSPIFPQHRVLDRCSPQPKVTHKTQRRFDGFQPRLSNELSSSLSSFSWFVVTPPSYSSEYFLRPFCYIFFRSLPLIPRSLPFFPVSTRLSRRCIIFSFIHSAAPYSVVSVGSPFSSSLSVSPTEIEGSRNWRERDRPRRAA